MKKARILGLTVGTALHSIISLYLSLLILYNSVDFLYNWLCETKFANKYLSIDERLIGPLFLSAVGILISCVILTVIYRQQKKRCLFIWGGVFLYIAMRVPSELSISYNSPNFIKILYGCLIVAIAILFIAEAVYAVYAFVKTIRNRELPFGQS